MERARGKLVHVRMSHLMVRALLMYVRVRRIILLIQYLECEIADTSIATLSVESSNLYEFLCVAG